MSVTSVQEYKWYAYLQTIVKKMRNVLVTEVPLYNWRSYFKIEQPYLRLKEKVTVVMGKE